MIRSRWWAIALAVLVSAQTGAQERSAPPFFPVAVWYAGGTARAPMVSPIDSESPSRWRADLQQIKALGFNTVRTWGQSWLGLIWWGGNKNGSQD